MLLGFVRLEVGGSDAVCPVMEATIMANDSYKCRKIALPVSLDSAINRWTADLKITRNEFVVQLLLDGVQELDNALDEIWAARARRAERQIEHDTAPDVADVWVPSRSRHPYEGMYDESGVDPYEGMYADDGVDRYAGMYDESGYDPYEGFYDTDPA